MLRGVGARSFHGPRDYLEAAQDPNATADDLRLLARSVYVFVRIAVANHPATPDDVLGDLLPDPVESWNDQELLLALAKHQRTPLVPLTRIAEMLPELLHARDARVSFAAGVALFGRDDVPSQVLVRLLEDSRVTTQFRKVVARETTRQDIREVLMTDRSEHVRRAAERRS